ncbi:ankyrin repeat domain-containing protein [Undibacterium fentianense]|uniref:Ankyrin repeat domain-containing protein n=1 Tax=Undibacterium fentianense TaxID=2828728 RepID=A0A941E5D9_9BURK|nr:ankyrin repeat domain-containing protein [Undibacterium fentianense]MBR7801387.1 ankyrin repeat domain-containing protein [Undibacterium fentianense]
MTPSHLDFIRLVVEGDVEQVARCLAVTPSMASTPSSVGATRTDSSRYFFSEIAHYLYAGDTALHLAAAAFQRQIAEILVTAGADCQAKNRRGAEPLHYAADGNRHAPVAQAQTIDYLISVGADPNATDGSAVSPLHRAVRTRSIAAVAALVKGGADPRKRNAAGSTPLHLAVQTTGRSGSGTDHSRAQQAAIIKFLIEQGAKVTDKDGRGRSIYEAASDEPSRSVLRELGAG